MNYKKEDDWRRECAKKFGVSPERVDQIYKSAIKKIHHYLLVNKQIRCEWKEMMWELF